jgi:arginine exporter protein ArgO
MSIASAFGTGMLAGLGVAVPLGAIGILIVRQSAVSGLRSGAVAASAVAMVDTAYCVAALVLGGLIARWLEAAGGAPTAVAALVLIAVGAWGMFRTRGEVTGARSPFAAPSHPRTFALFVALTAVNPVTLLYFTALAATLPRGEITTGTMFVLGVSAASLMWQLLLAGAGFRLRARISSRSHTIVSFAGYGIVIALGLLMLGR